MLIRLRSMNFFLPLQRTGICASNNKARIDFVGFTVIIRFFPWIYAFRKFYNFLRLHTNPRFLRRLIRSVAILPTSSAWATSPHWASARYQAVVKIKKAEKNNCSRGIELTTSTSMLSAATNWDKSCLHVKVERIRIHSDHASQKEGITGEEELYIYGEIKK